MKLESTEAMEQTAPAAVAQDQIPENCLSRLQIRQKSLLSAVEAIFTSSHPLQEYTAKMGTCVAIK